MGTDATSLFPSSGSAPRRETKRKSALSWSPDEIQFADLMLRTWNETLAHVTSRAYDKRRNRFKAIQFHRRNCARPAHERFTTDMIRAGLAAYAACEVNKKVGWKSFPDFLPDAEELLDKQLKRIGYRAPPPPNPQRDAVAPFFAHLGLVEQADKASDGQNSLGEFVAWKIKFLKRYRNAGAEVRHFENIQTLMARFKGLPADRRQGYWGRALDLYEDYYGRPANSGRTDKNRLAALVLALLDRDSTKGGAK